MSFDYDLFVIGAGSGGVRASRVASQLGAKVAVAEDKYLGGTCVNVGCVPKKLFVYASEFSKNAKDGEGFGWNTPAATFDWKTLRENKDSEIHRLNGIYGNLLENAGVTLINGHARIVDPHTVQVAGKNYTAKYILIAVGGWPKRPDIPGAEYMTDSNQVFYLDELPRKVLVQGGGYIAVEFAGIFNGLGVDTTLCYRGPLFLRGFDGEVRRFVESEVSKNGVSLQFNDDIAQIDKTSDGQLRVQFTSGQDTVVDQVFTAIGRTPYTDNLGLENTAIQQQQGGTISVDDNFRTDEPSIFALGDVVGRKPLTPVALAEGMALANYLFNDTAVSLDYDNIATAVFCQPNIATVGKTEEEALSAGVPINVYTSEFRPLKNTMSGSSERTFMKLIVRSDNDKVIGAHMAGPEAGEIVQGLAVAIKAGATKAVFDATIGIHPTSAEEFVTMRTATR